MEVDRRNKQRYEQSEKESKEMKELLLERK